MIRLVFLSLAIITLAIIGTMPLLTAHAQRIQLGPSASIPTFSSDNPNVFVDDEGNTWTKGVYEVFLKDEVFSPIDNDPKFTGDNKDKIKTTIIPEEQEKIDPYLKHEYDVKIGSKIFKKVEQYNGTVSSSLSPLKMQNAKVESVYSKVARGFSVEGVDDISIFVNDPDIAAVEPRPMDIPLRQVETYNADRMNILTIPNRLPYIENPANVDVLVMDEIVQPGHPDINGPITTTCGLSTSVNWNTNSCKTGVNNGLAHGTNVAGICCARDNLGGVAGPAEGARVHSWIICGKFATGPPWFGCSGSTIAGWQYAAANGIEVVNMSYGPHCGDGVACNTWSTSTDNAATTASNAGVVLVASAGNSRASANNLANCHPTAVLCVSAMANHDAKCGGLGPDVPLGGTLAGKTQHDDQRAYFSNYGTAVDLMAPGTNSYGVAASYSTAPLGGYSGTATWAASEAVYPFIGASIHGIYVQFGGTSEAAPWVTGSAAALKALHPSWTASQVRTDLINNAISQTQACDTSTNVGGLKYTDSVVVASSKSSEPILNPRAID